VQSFLHANRENCEIANWINHHYLRNKQKTIGPFTPNWNWMNWIRINNRSWSTAEHSNNTHSIIRSELDHDNITHEKYRSSFHIRSPTHRISSQLFLPFSMVFYDLFFVAIVQPRGRTFFECTRDQRYDTIRHDDTQHEHWSKRKASSSNSTTGASQPLVMWRTRLSPRSRVKKIKREDDWTFEPNECCSTIVVRCAIRVAVKC